MRTDEKRPQCKKVSCILWRPGLGSHIPVVGFGRRWYPGCRGLQERSYAQLGSCPVEGAMCSLPPNPHPGHSSPARLWRQSEITLGKIWEPYGMLRIAPGAASYETNAQSAELSADYNLLSFKINILIKD